jgi:SAM-dependent methyltransferase
MGIDTHALNFLTFVSRKQFLGSVATIGRQHLMVSRFSAVFGSFCEDFLCKKLGATRVESYDFSGFEGATHLVDMNLPLVSPKQYDTVIDCGCTEHIFNVAQALKNISGLCAPTGQIVHVLPANNFCGHGFWQFSPQLFFSLYSKENGYGGTEVFLADLRKPREWFQVKPPTDGQRVDVISSSPLYVMCRTQKTVDACHYSVQQADYMHAWANRGAIHEDSPGFMRRAKSIIKRNRASLGLALALREKARAVARDVINPSKLSTRNRYLKKHEVAQLLAG